MNTIKSDDLEKLEMAMAQRDALIRALREIAEPIQARSADNLRARATEALRSIAVRSIGS
jgi:exopolyphosphatase/pppGpp-phosphohydrolase